MAYGLPEGFELDQDVTEDTASVPEGFEIDRPSWALPEGFELDEPEGATFTGAAKALGRGAAEGLTTGLPEMAGEALEFVGGQLNRPVKALLGETAGEYSPFSLMEKGGKAVKEWSQEKAKDWFGEAPEDQPWLEKIIYEGSKMLAPSIIPGGVATTGARILKGMSGVVAGAKAAKLAGDTAKYTDLIGKAKTIGKSASNWGAGSAGVLFGLSQAQSTIDSANQRADELERQGLTDQAEEARAAGRGVAPYLTGAIEAVGEFFGTKYLGKLLGVTDIEKRAPKELAKQFLRTMGVEVGTEMGQAAGETGIEKAFGVRPDADVLEETLGVIGPTAFMTLLTGGLASGANLARKKPYQPKVQDPKTIVDNIRSDLARGQDDEGTPFTLEHLMEYRKDPVVAQMGLSDEINKIIIEHQGAKLDQPGSIQQDAERIAEEARIEDAKNAFMSFNRSGGETLEYDVGEWPEYDKLPYESMSIVLDRRRAAAQRQAEIEEGQAATRPPGETPIRYKEPGDIETRIRAELYALKGEGKPVNIHAAAERIADGIMLQEQQDQRISETGRISRDLSSKWGMDKSRKEKVTETEDREFEAWARKAADRRVSDEELLVIKKMMERAEEEGAFKEWQAKSGKSYARTGDVPPGASPLAEQGATGAISPIPDQGVTEQGEVSLGVSSEPFFEGEGYTAKRVEDKTGEWYTIDIDQDVKDALDTAYELTSIGEPGRRIFTEKAPGEGGGSDVTGYGSTYPDFLKGKGWSAKDVLTAIDKASKGERLGKRQLDMAVDALEWGRDAVYQMKKARLLDEGIERAEVERTERDGTKEGVRDFKEAEKREGRSKEETDALIAQAEKEAPWLFKKEESTFQLTPSEATPQEKIQVLRERGEITSPEKGEKPRAAFPDEKIKTPTTGKQKGMFGDKAKKGETGGLFETSLSLSPREARSIGQVSNTILEGIRSLQRPGQTRQLVSIPKLRDALKMPAGDFDHLMGNLAKSGQVSLHEYDMPFGISEEERNKLFSVPDPLNTKNRGRTYYGGVVPKFETSLSMSTREARSLDITKEKPDTDIGGKPHEWMYPVSKRPYAHRKALEFLSDAFEQEIPAESVRIVARTDRKAKESEAVAKQFGLSVIFFESTIPVEGFYNRTLPNTIFIDAAGQDPLLKIAGHELLHSLKANEPELYSYLDKMMRKNIINFQGYVDSLGQSVENAGLSALSENANYEEFYADFVGSQFIKPEFWQKVAEGKPSLGRRILMKVQEILRTIQRTLRGYPKGRYLTDIEKAQNLVARIIYEYEGRRSFQGKDESATMLSVTKKGEGRNIPAASPKAEGGNPFKESKIQKPVYHGGGREILEFRPDTDRGELGAAYFIEDKNVAEDYAWLTVPRMNLPENMKDKFLREDGSLNKEAIKEAYITNQFTLVSQEGRVPTVTSVYINVKNPLDPSNLTITDLVKASGGKDKFIDKIEQWDSDLFEEYKREHDYLREEDQSSEKFSDWFIDKFDSNMSEIADESFAGEDTLALSNYSAIRIAKSLDIYDDLVRIGKYDALVYDDYESKGRVWVVFDPKQIHIVSSPNPTRPPESGGQTSLSVYDPNNASQQYQDSLFNAPQPGKKSLEDRYYKATKKAEKNPDDLQAIKESFKVSSVKTFTERYLKPSGIDHEKFIRETGLIMTSRDPEDLNKYFRRIQTTTDIAERFESARNLLDVQINRQGRTNTMAIELRKMTEDYFSLPTKQMEKVDLALAHGDRIGKYLKVDTLKNKFQLSPEEIKAYFAMRKTMDYVLEFIMEQKMGDAFGHGRFETSEKNPQPFSAADIIKAIKNRNNTLSRKHEGTQAQVKEAANDTLRGKLIEMGLKVQELDFVMQEGGLADWVFARRAYMPHGWKTEWRAKVVLRDGREFMIEVPTLAGKIKLTREGRRKAAEKAALQEVAAKLGGENVSSVRLIHHTELPVDLYEGTALATAQGVIESATQNIMGEFESGLTDAEKSKLKEIGENITKSLQELYLAKGWGRHLLARKGIQGYRIDFRNVVPEYLYGFSAYHNKMIAAREFAKYFKVINASNTPQLWAWAKEYVSDMLGDTQEAGMFKRVVGFYFLAGDISAAALNMTQNWTHAVGILRGIQVKGGPTAEREIATAMKDVAGAWIEARGMKLPEKSKHLTSQEMEAIKEAFERGLLDPQFFGEVTGLHTNKWYMSGADKAQEWLYKGFIGAEAMNRMSTFIAAFRRAQRAGEAKAVDIASKAVIDSHFLYGKGNRPELIRKMGMLGNIAYTFGTYPLNNIFFLKQRALNILKAATPQERRTAMKVLGSNLAYIFAFGGLNALPFMFLGKLVYGIFTDPEEDWEVLAHKYAPQWAARGVVRGIPSVFGNDMSWKVEGTDIGITPIGIKTAQTIARKVYYQGYKPIERGEAWHTLFMVMPDMLSNPYKAFFAEGAGTGIEGKPLIDYTPGEKALKATGFSPTRESETRKVQELAREKRDIRVEKLGSFAERYIVALKEKDPATRSEEIKAIGREVTEYNQTEIAKGKEGLPIGSKEIEGMIKRRKEAREKGYEERMPKYMRPYQTEMGKTFNLTPAPKRVRLIDR